MFILFSGFRGLGFRVSLSLGEGTNWSQLSYPCLLGSGGMDPYGSPYISRTL